jgi:hypothetical protein
MGVADLIAELGPSSTNFTNLSHFNKLLGANSQNSTRTTRFGYGVLPICRVHAQGGHELIFGVESLGIQTG